MRHGLLVVTRSDLAEPELARDEAREPTSPAPRSAGIPAVARLRGDRGRAWTSCAPRSTISSPRCPRPTRRADVRLWVDRAFTIRGAGTVVTGTLAAGRCAVDDELELHAPTRRRAA